MFRNYLKIALRNFWKNKTSSAINIFGLTIGLTSCLLIALYIQHEVGYDSFEKKGNRIARVIMEYSFAGSSQSNKGNYTSVRVASVFKRTFPEVESAIKMTEYPRVVSYKDKLIDEKNFINENPIGKALKVGSDSNLYKITGIIQDCPSNSQIKFDFLASFSSLGITADYEKTYWDANYTTYLLLKNKGSRETLQAKLPAFMKKEMAGGGATINFWLEPFSRIHLYSEYGGFEPNN